MEALTDLLKAIFAVLSAIVLAIFAKRYADMKKRERENKRKLVEDVKATIIHRNDSTDLESLVDRENERSKSRHDN